MGSLKYKTVNVVVQCGFISFFMKKEQTFNYDHN